MIQTPGGDLSVVRMRQCEHVHVHAGLRLRGAKLCIYAPLINSLMIPETRVPSSAYRRNVLSGPGDASDVSGQQSVYGFARALPARRW